MPGALRPPMKPDYRSPFRNDSLVSTMAGGLKGSEILKIAGEVRAMRESGRALLDLTVGDFAPAQFRIPAELERGIVEALQSGETNYPPSNGMPGLRQAVVRLYARELGMEIPLESVICAGGTRPLIYATYRAIVDPGEIVVYPVPSWNNNHYVHLVGAQGVEVVGSPERSFLPTAEELAPHLSDARMLALCSPLNPAGTMFSASTLGEICDLVLAVNDHRKGKSKPLYLLYDQVYWMLAFGDSRHVHPVELRAAMAPYTIYVDGISKGLAATGVRVGYGVGPPEVIRRMSDIIGHMGAWAPRAEQVATGRFLDDADALERHRATMGTEVKKRLDALYAGVMALREKRLPVEAVPPAGAIYLTLRIAAHGKRPSYGDPLVTNDQVRKFVLDHAGIALVPFQSFAFPGESGWFRASVGAVSLDDIEKGLPRLESALRMLV